MQNADGRPIRGFVGLFGIKSLGKAIRRNLGLSVSNYEQIKLTGYQSQKMVYTFLCSRAPLSLSCDLTKFMGRGSTDSVNLWAIDCRQVSLLPFKGNKRAKACH